MYLLVLALLLGAERGSSTCENVRSASTPCSPVAQFPHYHQHFPMLNARFRRFFLSLQGGYVTQVGLCMSRRLQRFSSVNTHRAVIQQIHTPLLLDHLLSPADGQLEPMVELQYSYSRTSLHFVAFRGKTRVWLAFPLLCRISNNILWLMQTSVSAHFPL